MACAAAVLVAIVLVWVLWNLRVQALLSGERLSESLAQVADEQTTRSIQSMDLGLELASIRLLHLKQAGQFTEENAREVLLTHLKERPYLYGFWLHDAQGRVVADTRVTPARTDTATRAYFDRHLTPPPDGLHLGTPVRQVDDGQWLLHAARALRANDGRSEGVIVAVVRPHFFDNLWRTMNLGVNGSIALMRRDGTMLLRSPFSDAIIGQNYRDRPLFRQLLPRSPTGSYIDASSVDGVTRLFAYRALSERPELVIVVGQSYDAVLAFWFRLAALTSAAWATLFSLVVGGSVYLQRFWRVRANMECAIHESEEKYRSIFESSLDAILLTLPDGAILGVNPAACRMFGYSEEEFGRINRSDLADVADPRLALALQERQRTGRFHGELTLLRKNGERFAGEIMSSIFFNRLGQARASMIIRDITERKRSDTALRDNARQVQALSRRILEAQESERRRVARELHDELGQTLTAIKINLQAGQRFRDQQPGALETDNVRMIDDALGQVRSLALALRPSMLDDLGLVPALRWLTEQTLSRCEIGVDFRHDMPPSRLAPEIETTCFRVAQEALTNVVRHARASHVTMSLQLEGDTLELRIQDDGCGFDPVGMRARAAAGGSIGVLGMQERAMLIGGDLQITSEPGHGSTVCLRCPMRRQGETA